MKNLRKLLAVIIAVAMMATMMIPAFADTKTDAEIVTDLGMLKGAGDGVTDEYLATTPTRIQAAIMFLRLQGLEDEALAYEGTDNFEDADLVWSGGQAILAYLKANPDLGWIGVGDGSFDPLATIDAKSYAKVMLNALGFVQGEDFEWADVEEFAAEIGLTVAEGEFTVNALAAATVEALKAENKAGVVLIEALIEAGIVSQVAAEAAGLVSAALTATVSATGASKITVAFNKAVDDTKATFAVKKGTFTANIKEVTFAADKKSAVVELSTKMTEGTYTVTVGGLGDALTGSVTVTDEKVAKIEFDHDKAVLDRTDSKIVRAYFKVYNQYGEDITETATDLNATAGKGSAVPNNGVVTMTVASGEYTLDEKVALSIINAPSGTFASSVLTVSAKAQVATVEIASLYHEDDETLTADSEADEFKLVIKAKDQYGSDMKVASEVKADVLVTVSNIAVANVLGGANDPTFGTTSIDDETEVTLPLAGPLTAGTSKVSIISRTTGKMASFDVVVIETKKVDVLTLSAPAVAVVGEDIEIPFTAIDQFGNAMTKASELESGINSKSVTGNGAVEFEQDYVKNIAKLIVKGITTKGSHVLTIVTGTNKVVQLSFNVVEEAEPTVIAGIDPDSDFTKVLAKGAMSEMVYDSLIINDQYGRKIDSSDVAAYLLAGDYKILVQTGSASKVSLTGDVNVTANVYSITNTTDVVEFNGIAKGSSTITVKLQIDDGGWKDVANSAFTFTAKTVEKADIASYEIADFPKLFYNKDYTAADKYATKLEVNGILADGSKVALPLTDYYSVTISDANVDIVDGMVGSDGAALTDDDWTNNERTVLVVVTVDAATGAQVLTKNITVSKKLPEPTTLALKSEGSIGKKEGDGVVSADLDDANTQGKVEDLAADIVEIKDQYGKVITTTFSQVIVTNLPKDKTLDGMGSAALEEGETFNVTAITSNGKIITFKVILK